MNPYIPGFLGVEQSLTGKRWLGLDYDERLALALSQRLELPDIVGRLLASRGVSLEQAFSFLNPTLREMIPNPMRFKGMIEAANRIRQALERGEKIAVFGDYDVDGATSSALLCRFIRASGGNCRIYIPDRINEGYGPNAQAMLKLKEEGVSLVITVDCGSTAFAPLEEAANAGLDVIVTDHHEAEPRLPTAIAVVNPNRVDEDGSYGHLAGVGVTYILVIAANKTLREAGWYNASRPEPDLMQWLDLVALGTICDVVPLKGVNRALVAQGLKVMARRGNAGLAALSDLTGIKEKPDSYHAGFVIGPRVNAGGRVGESSMGARLLATQDEEEAVLFAQKLNEFNKNRQEIESGVLQAAILQAEKCKAENLPLLLVVGDAWHPRVIGIVASRLKDRYNLPSCVVSMDNEGIGKGSGRSVPGADLGAAIIAARQAGIIIHGGGHAMAAGFTVHNDKINEFKHFLAERLGSEPEQSLSLTASLTIDAPVDVGGVTTELAKIVRQCGPFGTGNPEPCFAVTTAKILKAEVVGSGHVRCFVTGPSGGRLKAIAFRSADSQLGSALLKANGNPLHLAGNLRIDSWQGKDNVQLIITDAAFA